MTARAPDDKGRLVFAGKAGGGEKNKRWTTDRVRERIRCAMLINRLEGVVAGRIVMSQSQVTAALGLLKKVLPDLKQVEVSGSIHQTHEHVAVSEARTRLSELLGERATGADAPALPH